MTNWNHNKSMQSNEETENDARLRCTVLCVWKLMTHAAETFRTNVKLFVQSVTTRITVANERPSVLPLN